MFSPLKLEYSIAFFIEEQMQLFMISYVNLNFNKTCLNDEDWFRLTSGLVAFTFVIVIILDNIRDNIILCNRFLW